MNMLKQILTATTALLLVFNVSAQAPGSTGGEGTTKEVTDTEIENFAQSFNEVQQVQQQHQQKMMTAVKESGLTMKEYQEIARASRNPKSEVEISQEDKEKYQTASSEVQSINAQMKTSIKETVNDNDLTMSRFQQIYMQMRQDKELQQKIQAEMNAGQGSDSQGQ